MINLLTLLACLVMGMVVRALGRFPADAHKTLNAFIINIALPALILRYVHAMHFDAGLLMPAAMPWLMFSCGMLFFLLLGRRFGWSRQTIGGLILSGALANTSFVGLPMIEAFYGAGYLSIGMVVDQLGTYLVLSTLGLIVAAVCAETGRTTGAALLRKIAAFPPFQAMLLASILIPVPFPDPLVGVLEKIGGVLAPIALISVGYQLRLSGLRGASAPLASGLVFKLVLGPAAMALLFVGGLHASGELAQVTIFEAAMGPQIGGAIVAMENGLNPRLVGLMVGVGIPLSILTASIWSLLLHAV